MGRVSEWFAVRDLCKNNGLQLSCGGIAPLAAQMIATADDSYAMCEYLRPTMADIHKYMVTPPRMANGRYYLEHESGLGMDFDWTGMKKADLVSVDSEVK